MPDWPNNDDQMVGTRDIAGISGDAAGSLVERVAAIQANVTTLLATLPLSVQALLPPRITAPIDVTIGSNQSLTERVAFFKNLTISTGFTLTGMVGGQIIVVEETLALVGTGRLSVAALGGRSGAQVASGNPGLGGYGGGAWGADLATLTRTMGAFFSVGTISASNPYDLPPKLQRLMADGGAGAINTGTATAGGAGPRAASFPGASIGDLSDWAFWMAVADLILERNNDDATAGGIGGGGGASGSASIGATGNAGAGGVIGGKGADGVTDGAGGGGSGVGGGGGGGGTSTGGTGVGGAGGRGGGVLLVLCRTINNAGTIDADAAAGSQGGTDSGGGGGGGGGAVALAYESVAGSGVGTVRANAGAGGATNGNGRAGASGGAGLARAFKIRSGA